MTETDIEYGHSKTILHARSVNKSRKIVTSSHLNSTNFNDNFNDNFMQEKVESQHWSYQSYHLCHLCFFIISMFGSVLKLLFDDFFHIAFDYTISL